MSNRYLAAAHAMQSGVKMTQELDAEQRVVEPETSPKHLRVGVNSAMADHGALVKLLIAKGLITEAEYVAAITEMMEIERDRYAAELSERLGAEVSLA